MEKTADAYLSSDGVIRIVTRGTTSIGCPIWHGPVYFLKITYHSQEIGKKALEALNGFQDRTVSHPKNQEEWKLRSVKGNESLQLTSSWRSFLKKGAKCLSLVMDEYKITIWPTRNNIAANIKSDVEYSFLEQKNHICSTNPEELGRAILAAFDDCE